MKYFIAYIVLLYVRFGGRLVSKCCERTWSWRLARSSRPTTWRPPIWRPGRRTPQNWASSIARRAEEWASAARPVWAQRPRNWSRSSSLTWQSRRLWLAVCRPRSSRWRPRTTSTWRSSRSWPTTRAESTLATVCRRIWARAWDQCTWLSDWSAPRPSSRPWSQRYFGRRGGWLQTECMRSAFVFVYRASRKVKRKKNRVKQTKTNKTKKCCNTYKSSENAKQLDDVRVGDRVESAEERIYNDDESRDDDRCSVVQIHDDTDRAAESGQNGRRPEDFAKQSRYEEQTAHSLAVLALKRIDHGHVALATHTPREQEASEDQTERVADRRLTPYQATRIDHLRCTVYESTAHPCRCTWRRSSSESEFQWKKKRLAVFRLQIILHG